MKRALVVLGSLILLATTVARAEDVIPANKTTGFYDFSVWNPTTCAFPGKPRHKLSKPPKHGKVSVVYGVAQASNMPSYCKGKVKGLQVYYTPNKGYRGPDSFVITVYQPRFLNDSGPLGRTMRPSFIVK